MKKKRACFEPDIKEKAFELLCGTENKVRSNQYCFDEFGNYAYPTDLVVNTPNTAVGTSSNFSFFKEGYLL